MKQKSPDQGPERPEKTGGRTPKYDRHIIERLQFEMLLSDLSTSFINLPAQNIDQGIESGLRRVGEFLGFDRASLLQESEKKQFINTHVWSKPGTKPPKDYILEEQFPGVFKHLKEKKKPLSIPDVDNPPPELVQDAETLKKVEHKSVIGVPLIVGGTFLGALTSGSISIKRSISDELIHRFRMLGEIFATALMRQKNEEALRQAFNEIKQLKDQLEAEWSYMREEIKLEHDFSNVIGQSEALQNVLLQVEQVAATDTTVLILGETGTGKELIARSLHNVSLRRDRPLIKVDCASLPANLIENELFGHEKGAFTGAAEKKIGRLELADGGTVFLDEMGELPLELQSKLLRVLQENAFERVGGTKTIQIDIRVIAATNRDLKEDVRKGVFREDLWYRLNVFSITVPPLRERKEDIPLLVDRIVQQNSKKLGSKINKISNSELEVLQNYSWPGNIRELENVITRSLITSTGKTLKIETFKEEQNLPITGTDLHKLLLETEQKYVMKALEQTGWKIQGPHGAAKLLGIKPTTLRDRMKKIGIKRPTIT